MDSVKRFLGNICLSVVFVGETRLWLTGAIAAIGMVGVFLFSLIATLSISYTVSDWFIFFVVLGLVIPMLLSVAYGYFRRRTGYASITNEKDFDYVELGLIEGFVWLLNIVGCILLIVLVLYTVQSLAGLLAIISYSDKVPAS